MELDWYTCVHHSLVMQTATDLHYSIQHNKPNLHAGRTFLTIHLESCNLEIVFFNFPLLFVNKLKLYQITYMFSLSECSFVASELTLAAQVRRTLQSLLLDRRSWSWKKLNRTLHTLEKKVSIIFNLLLVWRSNFKFTNVDDRCEQKQVPWYVDYPIFWWHHHRRQSQNDNAYADYNLNLESFDYAPLRWTMHNGLDHEYHTSEPGLIRKSMINSDLIG